MCYITGKKILKTKLEIIQILSGKYSLCSMLSVMQLIQNMDKSPNVKLFKKDKVHSAWPLIGLFCERNT